MNHSGQLRACVLGLLGACALSAAQAHQAHPASESVTAPAAAAQADAGHVQALRAVRDKATGKLRAPTADEEKAMAAAERAERKARGEPEAAASQPVVVVRHANGMLSAKLGPEHLMFLKGERMPDGSVRRFHPDGTTHDHAPAVSTKLPTE